MAHRVMRLQNSTNGIKTPLLGFTDLRIFEYCQAVDEQDAKSVRYLAGAGGRSNGHDNFSTAKWLRPRFSALRAGELLE